MKCDKETRGTSQKVTTCMYVCVRACEGGGCFLQGDKKLCELSEVTGWF